MYCKLVHSLTNHVVGKRVQWTAEGQSPTEATTATASTSTTVLAAIGELSSTPEALEQTHDDPFLHTVALGGPLWKIYLSLWPFLFGSRITNIKE